MTPLLPLTPAEHTRTVTITENRPPLRSFASIYIMIVDRQAKLRVAFCHSPLPPSGLQAQP